MKSLLRGLSLVHGLLALLFACASIALIVGGAKLAPGQPRRYTPSQATWSFQ